MILLADGTCIGINGLGLQALELEVFEVGLIALIKVGLGWFGGIHALSLPNAENAWIDLHFVAGDNAEDASSVGFLMSPEAIAALCKTGLPVEVTVDALSSSPKSGSDLE